MCKIMAERKSKSRIHLTKTNVVYAQRKHKEFPETQWSGIQKHPVNILKLYVRKLVCGILQIPFRKGDFREPGKLSAAFAYSLSSPVF